MPSTSSLLKIFPPYILFWGKGRLWCQWFQLQIPHFFLRKNYRAKCHHCYPCFRQWHSPSGIKTISILELNVLEHTIFIWKLRRSSSAWWKKDGIWLPCSFSDASVLPVCAGHCCNVRNTVWCTATSIVCSVFRISSGEEEKKHDC